jgi:hypothetical protein
MRTFKRLSAMGLLGCIYVTSLRAEDPIRHRFLCCDYLGGKVCIVSAEGVEEWRVEAKNPQDCWMLPGGKILFAHRNGTNEVTPGKQVVREYKAPESAEVHSAQPLPDGEVLVVECGTKRILEVDNGVAISVNRKGPFPPSKSVKVEKVELHLK